MAASLGEAPPLRKAPCHSPKLFSQVGEDFSPGLVEIGKVPASLGYETLKNKGTKNMTFPITAVYALPLIPIFVILFFRVVSKRTELKASIGDAGDSDLHERIRHHGNFVEWVPFVLILMLLAEGAGANSIALHTAGGLLVVGRILHPLGLKANVPTHPLRVAGNSLNLLATVILGVLIAMARFGF
jgi:uncharacterized protein